jgi:hydrogenase nickel incorporation protein HypA/HybF
MHELSIAQSVVDAVCERAAGRAVRSVRMRVGALTAVVPEAMCSASISPSRAPWPRARGWTSSTAGIARCRSCGADVELADLILLCPCGSADLEVTAGRELQIVSMEVG